MIGVHNRLIILLSFLVGIVLTLLPMPDWTIWLRPAWLLMILIFWVMSLPYKINLGTAWVLGIMLDILNGTLLGEHALGLVVVTYIVLRMVSRFRMFPLIQQSLCVFCLVMLYQFILYCVQGFVGELPKSNLYWLSSLTSLILWPWVSIILEDSKRRFRVA